MVFLLIPVFCLLTFAIVAVGSVGFTRVEKIAATVGIAGAAVAGVASHLLSKASELSQPSAG